MEHTDRKLYAEEPFGVEGVINVVGGKAGGCFARVHRDRSKDIAVNSSQPQKDAARLVLCWNGHDEAKGRNDIMVDALAEIKAKVEGDGNPEQPLSVKGIINACIEELDALAKAEQS